jgi:hypothetical protein
VDRVVILRLIVLPVIAVALGYALLLLRRRRISQHAANPKASFRPRIGFTRLDGMASVALLLVNESNAFVWAEEIEIFLADLEANEQVAEPSCHGRQKIRQTLGPTDMLPISLAEAIYRAAGKPQREYSCSLSAVVRYRIGEEWFEKIMETYRVGMMGLTASKLRRARGAPPRIQTPEEPREVHADDAKRGSAQETSRP